VIRAPETVRLPGKTSRNIIEAATRIFLEGEV